ncbi:MAG TPA: hypothetical protein VNK43_08665 [Gemmatimonadales bacterium]|nr:hypothetical protein [Gemmatimonadales bacterium]
MKATTLIGIVLVVLGLLGLIFGGIPYRERDRVDLGPVDVTAEREDRVPLSPILSGVALVGGIVLLVAGSRRSSA